MQRVAFKDLPLRSNVPERITRALHWLFLGLFLVAWVLAEIRSFGPAVLGNTSWPDGLLVILAAATTLASLAKQLPGQNVLGAALITSVLGAGLHTLGALTGIPFGPFTYGASIGQKLFEPLPWAVPLLWPIIILNSRGVARLILRRWRTGRNYGWWLMALTILLVVLFDLNLEPFADSVNGYWIWQATKLPLNWYGAPVVNFFAWALAALLILFVVTPFLLNKKPVQHPPDYHPLLLWLSLALLFLTGAAVHHLWLAVGFQIATCLLIMSAALVGSVKLQRHSARK